MHRLRGSATGYNYGQRRLSGGAWCVDGYLAGLTATATKSGIFAKFRNPVNVIGREGIEETIPRLAFLKLYAIHRVLDS